MHPAIRLADHPGVVVDPFHPNRPREGDEVVEPGLDGLGVRDEDAAPGLDHLRVEPVLALGRLHLVDVEEDRELSEVLLEQAQVALRKPALPGVEEKDQDVAPLVEIAADPREQPPLLRGQLARGEELPLGDDRSSDLLRILENEGGEVVRRTVEVRRQQAHGPPELAGVRAIEIGPDLLRQAAREALLLGEHLLAEPVVLGDLDRDLNLPAGRQLSLEILLVHDESDREEVLQDEQREDARGLAHLADLEWLALLLAVTADPIADDLALALEAGGNEDLAIAVASHERSLLGPPEGLPEAWAHRPEVGEEGARITSHQRAGEGEGRDAGDLDQPVSRLLLGTAEVRVL